MVETCKAKFEYNCRHYECIKPANHVGLHYARVITDETGGSGFAWRISEGAVSFFTLAEVTAVLSEPISIESLDDIVF